MATKKKNRHYKTKQIRRALNSFYEISKISGLRLHRHRWGEGVSRSDLIRRDSRFRQDGE